MFWSSKKSPLSCSTPSRLTAKLLLLGYGGKKGHQVFFAQLRVKQKIPKWHRTLSLFYEPISPPPLETPPKGLKGVRTRLRDRAQKQESKVFIIDTCQLRLDVYTQVHLLYGTKKHKLLAHLRLVPQFHLFAQHQYSTVAISEMEIDAQCSR